METQAKVKEIMSNYIQDGTRSTLECFQTICANLGLTHEFNVIVRLEKIMQNNNAIADFKAKGMYGRIAELCNQNAELYNSIEKELQQEEQPVKTQAASTATASATATAQGIAK